MPDQAIAINLDPGAHRQLGEDGLIVLWRDGRELGRREGLACIVSVCPHIECACEDVYLDAFIVEGQASAVSWDQEGVHLSLPAGTGNTRTTLDVKLSAIVDPCTGETLAHPDLPDATDPALLRWLASEMDGELLEVLYRFWALAKGHAPERQAKDIGLDEVEKYHLAYFDDLIEGTRPDEYILGGRRYWNALYLCPYADCDCHRAEVVFFDEAPESAAVEPDGAVGSLRLELGGAGGFKIVEMAAELGVPAHLIRDLWASFERRHDAGSFLRRREAQCKAVGETLWSPAAKPARAVPQPGRNDTCSCGSGKKFKKCCLGKGETPRSEQ
jgi:hypothetical protein